MKPLAIAALITLLATSFSRADSRDIARDSVSLLQTNYASVRRSDEISNIVKSFALAEEYQRRGDREQAERYYLLTIQKSRILMSALADQAPAASRPAPTRSGEKPRPLPAIPAPAAEPASAVRKPDSAPTQRPEQPADSRAQDDETEDAYPQEKIISSKLVGSADVYSVKKGDSLRLVAAKLGVSRQHLIEMNDLDPKASLKPGQKLRYNNSKIIPRHMRYGIVVNIPDRTLYYFKDGKLASSLPVALGVAKKGRNYDWTTPTGKFRIVAKQKDPTWFVPPSIQQEMEKSGREVITSMPPGKRNPLGRYAMKTSLPGILIHSTTKPGSIYSFASHGCIRVYPEQMERLFREIRINTPGEIIYQPVKLAVTEEGRVFLEVHRDVYGKNTALQELARHLIEQHNISDRVDWDKVELVVKRQAGLAEEISQIP